MNREQLKQKLRALRLDDSACSFSGGLPNEQLVLDHESNGKWAVYYSERGEKCGLRHFDSEDGACDYFLKTITHDSAIQGS